MCPAHIQPRWRQLLLEANMRGYLLLVSYISRSLHAEEILSTSLKFNQHILKSLN